MYNYPDISIRTLVRPPPPPRFPRSTASPLLTLVQWTPLITGDPLISWLSRWSDTVLTGHPNAESSSFLYNGLWLAQNTFFSTNGYTFLNILNLIIFENHLYKVVPPYSFNISYNFTLFYYVFTCTLITFSIYTFYSLPSSLAHEREYIKFGSVHEHEYIKYSLVHEHEYNKYSLGHEHMYIT